MVLRRLTWIVGAERLIQLFVIGIIVTGWYLCTWHIGAGYLILRQARWKLGVAYIVTVDILLALGAWLYLHLLFGQYTHNVAIYPQPEKISITEPYQCQSESGDMSVCTKGACAEKWKPPRTHHCSTCNVCRLEFDHHCPWIGTCITLANMKAFLLMLSIVPLATSLAISPIVLPLLSQVLQILDLSRNDEWAARVWWNWPGSWIVCSGPVGRLPVGIVLGYIIIGRTREIDDAVQVPGYVVEEPHLGLFALVIIALLLSCFSIILAVTSLRRILQGTTTVETLYTQSRRGNFICIPAGIVQRLVVAPALTGERIYDLGPANNWRLFAAKPVWTRTPQVYTWPKINPKVIYRILSTQTASDENRNLPAKQSRTDFNP